MIPERATAKRLVVVIGMNYRECLRFRDEGNDETSRLNSLKNWNRNSSMKIGYKKGAICDVAK